MAPSKSLLHSNLLGAFFIMPLTWHALHIRRERKVTMEFEIDSREITAEVLAYHAMEEGPEKDDERRRILKITDELIYLEPVVQGYISEEDACGFYLEERRNSEKILEAYRITKLDYPDYIGSIMRVRVRNYLMHKHEQETDIRRLHYEERFHGRMKVQDVEEIYEAEEKSREYGDAESIRCATTIREAVGRVMSSTARIRYEDTGLRCRGTRHGLLCMLLALPRGEGYNYIEHYGELLHVNPYSILNILRLRDEFDETVDEKVEKHREVIGKHFKILLRLNTAYRLADDEDERQKLLELADRLETLIDRRCERLRRENIGFTQREIGKLLGISRSTIGSNIRKARSYLTSKLGN